MTTRIQYGNGSERASIVLAQEALGKILVGDESLSTGNFLVFEDDEHIVEYKSTMKADAFISALSSATVSQIDTWVENNVATIAHAKALFKKILVVLAYQLRRGK